MFVSFCLHYAGVPEEAFPYDCGCTTWIDALSKRGMYAPVGEYQPKSGDVIFFDFDNDGRSDHVGLVSDVYDTDGSLVIETIEGNKVETVERFTYYNNTGILGYGILPENPNAPAKADKVEDEQTVFFTDDNTAEDTTVTDDETGSETVEEEALSYPAQSFDGLVGGIFVIVDADEGAFPEGTTMEVKAVDSAEIMDAVTDAVEKEVVRVQAVDITFRDADGNEIEPKIPVRVQMRAVGGTDGANQQVVVHVEDNGAASIVDAAREVGSRVDFDADSFSVYALVYTVDLHYEVNGKTYEFSLPGGGYITSRQLIEALGIIGDESQGVDLDQFVADIQRVEFSEPSLVWVGKLDSETTVGQVKADKGLECVYSADLTAEQVAEINAAAVSAGEWILISLQPFMSEETLSVTLQDGDVFTVKVTDAWVSRTVISASGETYTVTLQYGEEAGLPEDADLSVREILADTEEYEAYLNDSAATLKIASENVALARFFDIDIVDGGGEKVEPKAEVFVSITWTTCRRARCRPSPMWCTSRKAIRIFSQRRKR